MPARVAERRTAKVATAESEAAEQVAEEAVEAVAAEPAAVDDASPADEAAGEAEEASEPDGAAAADALEEPAPEPARVTVVDATATQAVLENGRGYAQFCDLALLDFASFVNPGGGYIRGSLAQEEQLCADSFLYNVLKEKRSWYQENRRRNINCELYRNRALVVPAVRFERGKMHAYADVLVVAAPNAKRARDEYGIKDERIETALRDRIRFALALCDEIGRTKLVAGAFGCGNFGCPTETVAEIFREELASGEWGMREVVFAVPASKWDENLPIFEHVLANFPAKNDESYADAAARVAAARAAKEAAAAAEDDEDDDDWRKYL